MSNSIHNVTSVEVFRVYLKHTKQFAFTILIDVDGKGAFQYNLLTDDPALLPVTSLEVINRSFIFSGYFHDVTKVKVSKLDIDGSDLTELNVHHRGGKDATSITLFLGEKA